MNPNSFAARRLAKQANSPKPSLPFNPGLVLDIFSPPIAFHAHFPRIAGGALPAILLSIAIDRTQQQADLDSQAGRPHDPKPQRNGWVEMTLTQWYEATGMTQWEFRRARAEIERRGLVTFAQGGPGQDFRFRVEMNRISEATITSADERYPELRDPDNWPSGEEVARRLGEV